MDINLALGPLVSLIAGILILIMPKLLNYIVAGYLIVFGLIGLFGGNNLNNRPPVSSDCRHRPVRRIQLTGVAGANNS